MNSLPCGKIHKIATGIGATTLEIRDKTRNSLIVCPTRALAGSKAIAEKIFYIGSKYGSLKPTSIDRIKKNIKNKKLTKVAVVSDSLVPLLNDLGKEAYKDFFIMFDEIDAYQSEISYRPRLEEAFEEYFKFPKDRRCMVSATLQEFSDDRLVGEPQTEIIIDSQQKPGINIIEYSDNKYATIKAYIESIRKKYPGDKILIAYNSIDGISKVMSILPEEYKAEAGILCSEERKKEFKPNVRAKIDKGKLSHKITFMTSAYFIGVDMLEKLHIAIVSDCYVPHCIITGAKMTQIFGRTRKGCITRTIVTNNDSNKFKAISDFKGELVDKAEISKHLLDALGNMKIDLVTNEYIRRIEKAIFEHSTYEKIKLLRISNKKYTHNYLGIDFLIQRQKSLNDYYSDFGLFLTNIGNSYYVNSSDTSKAKLSREEQRILERHVQDSNEIKLSKEMRILNEGADYDTRANSEVEILLDHIHAYEYRLFNYEAVRAEVEGHLRGDRSSKDKKLIRQLKNILNNLEAYIEDPYKSTLWKRLREEFDLFEDDKSDGNVINLISKSIFTRGEISRKLTKISIELNGDIIPQLESEHEAIKYFRNLFDTKRGRKKNARRDNGYKIIGSYHNVYKLADDNKLQGGRFLYSLELPED